MHLDHGARSAGGKSSRRSFHSDRAILRSRRRQILGRRDLAPDAFAYPRSRGLLPATHGENLVIGFAGGRGASSQLRFLEQIDSTVGAHRSLVLENDDWVNRLTYQEMSTAEMSFHHRGSDGVRSAAAISTQLEGHCDY